MVVRNLTSWSSLIIPLPMDQTPFVLTYQQSQLATRSPRLCILRHPHLYSVRLPRPLGLTTRARRTRMPSHVHQRSPSTHIDQSLARDQRFGVDHL
jgi:hypothetical protein